MALGGRTVAEWQASMSRLEFERWMKYHMDAPFDDLHRYHRPAALISTSMSGASWEELLRTLVDKHEPTSMSDITRRTLAALGVEPPANYKEPTWQPEAL